MEWTLRIENWIPVSVNKLLGSHWGKRKRLKQMDMDLIIVMAKKAGIPAATSRRSVHVHIVYPRKQRRYDTDNLCKSLLDGMK